MTDKAVQATIYVSIGLICFVLGIGVMQVGEKNGKLVVGNSSNGSCAVKIIKLQGNVYTYTYSSKDTQDNQDDPGAYVSAEKITRAIEEADADSTIKAIVLQVDSSGGSVVAGEEIANTLKRAKKPTIALIRSQGLSAAYWAASGAAYIIASPNSEVGSIGITASYTDNSGYNNKEGYVFHSISTGKYKDMLSPNKNLTKDEEAVVRAEIDEMLQSFIQIVSENRHLSESDVSEEVRQAKVFTGRTAIKFGLVDELGDKLSVRQYLSKKLGLPIESLSYCQ